MKKATLMQFKVNISRYRKETIVVKSATKTKCEEDGRWKIIKMFEQVTLFAAGYLRIFKHQTWRGGGHNILGQVLGEYRLRMKRRCTLVTAGQ